MFSDYNSDGTSVVLPHKAWGISQPVSHRVLSVGGSILILWKEKGKDSFRLFHKRRATIWYMVRQARRAEIDHNLSPCHCQRGWQYLRVLETANVANNLPCFLKHKDTSLFYRVRSWYMPWKLSQPCSLGAVLLRWLPCDVNEVEDLPRNHNTLSQTTCIYYLNALLHHYSSDQS